MSSCTDALSAAEVQSILRRGENVNAALMRGVRPLLRTRHVAGAVILPIFGMSETGGVGD